MLSGMGNGQGGISTKTGSILSGWNNSHKLPRCLACVHTKKYNHMFANTSTDALKGDQNTDALKGDLNTHCHTLPKGEPRRVAVLWLYTGRVGPDGCDQTLAVKSRKYTQENANVHTPGASSPPLEQLSSYCPLPSNNKTIFILYFVKDQYYNYNHIIATEMLLLTCTKYVQYFAENPGLS